VKEPIEIQYRDFYDVPRVFVTTYKGVQYLFDGSFDDAMDDYPNHYRVYVLPNLSPAELNGPWTDLASRSTASLGTMATSEIVFDASRRKYIEAGALHGLIQGQPQRRRTGTAD
jgi:hypothetical protein